MHSERISVVLVPLRDQWENIREYALVDPGDAERVNGHRWHARRKREGYVAGKVEGQRIPLQCFIYGDVPDGMVVDHINRWPLDNRRSNLRLVTPAQNAQNQGSRGGSSQHRGVTWDKSRGKWMARVMLDGRGHTVGRFDSEQEAAAAAAAFRREHMPFSTEARAAA